MKIVWFNTKLITSGGGERLSLETLRAFKKSGHEIQYVVFNYASENVFDGLYDDIPVTYKYKGARPKKYLTPFHRIYWVLSNRLWLRKQIKCIKPDIIYVPATWYQANELFLSCLFMKINYAVHIYGSMFAFDASAEKLKYGKIFKHAFINIRNSLESYQTTVPEKLPKMSIIERYRLERDSLIKYLAVKKAKKIYVLSKRNAEESQLLFNRKAIVHKGAYPEVIFNYKSKLDLRKKYNIQTESPVFLSISRLAKNKRIDLCIKGFAEFYKREQKGILLIGGRGSELEYLQLLVEEYGLDDKVLFVGFIPDIELWDYMQSCDVFVHLDLADFDIAPLEALALGSSVIWSEDMDMPELSDSINNIKIFSVKSNAKSVADAMHAAACSESLNFDDKDIKKLMSPLTWENYSQNILI